MVLFIDTIAFSVQSRALTGSIHLYDTPKIEMRRSTIGVASSKKAERLPKGTGLIGPH